MAESMLAEHLASERSHAARALLASPLLDAEAAPDAFRLVARHAVWLTDYFEHTCGWGLVVDPAAGFARLAKRAAVVDITRPMRRPRGEGAPFDRRRYQLLCLVCAELVRHPVTTVGFLAAAVAADAGLDTSRHGERIAFVDVLRTLMAWGALRATAGDVDAFVGSERANAILSADTARLHRLLVSATAPSALPENLDVEAATKRLLAEPRYGEAGDADSPGSAVPADLPDGADGVDRTNGWAVSIEARNRWARHRLGRRLIDDPAVHLDDLSSAERDYLASVSGRRWLRDRVAEAGFELEERSEGLLAIDPDAIATDRHFPAPMGNAHQLALLLVDHLVSTGTDGRRRLGRLDPFQLRSEIERVLIRFPSWARGQRDAGGPER
ncbi:MAG: hypothetical protein QOF20_3337, partial [Acidimicrobiaceae bacterium]|nr:hypothetical protein [Acidimicrobiaceae bacterium]